MTATGNARPEERPEDRVKRIQCDVTVAGGGIAGICAALAAAREGVRVVLVNDRSVLGGNASSEIGISMNGASHLGLNAAIYAREGGLVEEMRLRMAAYNEGGGYEKPALLDAVYFDMVYEEEKITLLLNTSIYTCQMEKDRICLAYARHHTSNVVYELESPYYIDATGNGVLAYEAGCSFSMGREGAGEYQERKAPREPDAYTMGNTFYFETVDCGHAVTYVPPAFARKVEEMPFLKEIHKPGNHRGLSVKGAHWSFEYGGQLDVVYDSEEIDLELRRLVYGIWDYIKNSGKYPEAATYALKRIHSRSGARESRRFHGDYMLTQNDIEEKRAFEDGVCMGGWPMDVHAPLGIYDRDPATEFIPVTGVYEIPFRCLYSREVENLLFAGRNVSVTHIALGSTRVMATCGCMGQAVGTAAALCRELGISPRTLYREQIQLLRERLAHRDQTIIGWHGPDDMAGRFTVEADREKSFENREVAFCSRLERDLALALMLETEKLDSLMVWVENLSGEDTVLVCRILEGDHRETFLPARCQKEIRKTVEAGKRGWIPLQVEARRGADGKVYLAFAANGVLALGMGRVRPVGAVTMGLYPKDCRDAGSQAPAHLQQGCCPSGHSLDHPAGTSAWRSACANHDSVPLDPATGYLYLDHRYHRQENIAFCNLQPAQRLYAPWKALSPCKRPYGEPNLWLGQGSYPWTMTLTAREPVQGSFLAVTFDTDLTVEPLSRLPECLARDVDIRVSYLGEQESRTIRIRDNWRRQVVMALEEKQVTGITITVLGSWGGEAGIYGVELW